MDIQLSVQFLSLLLTADRYVRAYGRRCTSVYVWMHMHCKGNAELAPNACRCVLTLFKQRLYGCLLRYVLVLRCYALCAVAFRTQLVQHIQHTTHMCMDRQHVALEHSLTDSGGSCLLSVFSDAQQHPVGLTSRTRLFRHENRRKRIRIFRFLSRLCFPAKRTNIWEFPHNISYFCRFLWCLSVGWSTCWIIAQPAFLRWAWRALWKFNGNMQTCKIAG